MFIRLSEDVLINPCQISVVEFEKVDDKLLVLLYLSNGKEHRVYIQLESEEEADIIKEEIVKRLVYGNSNVEWKLQGNQWIVTSTSYYPFYEMDPSFNDGTGEI